MKNTQQFLATLAVPLLFALSGCDSGSGKASPPGKDYGPEIKELKQQLTQHAESVQKLEKEYKQSVAELQLKLKKANDSLDKMQPNLDGFHGRVSQLSNELSSIQTAFQKLDRNLLLKAAQADLDKHLLEFYEFRQSVVTLFLQSQSGKNSTITIDPSSKGFLRLDHDTGFFLVSCKDAQPYLDGYKIILSVGNPFAGSYANTKFKVNWGKKPTKKLESPDDWQDWQKTLNSKIIEITEEIRSGSWNNIDLILTPAKPEDLGFIQLSAEAPIVSLTKPRQ